MAINQDKGWDYLNSDEGDFDAVRDSEGSWGHQDSDGSGSYYASDGSWAHRNSDGSSSYYGADGSWGQRNSDGSSSYYGADGSWGHRDSDGNGSYYGADGSWGHWNSDGSSSYYGADSNDEYIKTEIEDEDDGLSPSEEDSNNDDDTDLDYREGKESDDSERYSVGADAISALLGFGLVALIAGASQIKQARKEEERQEKLQKEQERIQREYKKAQLRELRSKRIIFYKRHWKGILFSFILVGIILFCSYKYIEYKKGIPVGIGYNEILHSNYQTAEKALKQSGFTNIYSSPIYDLSIEEIEIEYTVEAVSIRGEIDFTSESIFPYDSRIEIKYHEVASIQVPISAKKAKKRYYQEVESLFREAGFINIRLEPEYDLITGWITKEGAIEAITINGDRSFRETALYRPDAEIIINYHAFKKHEK